MANSIQVKFKDHFKLYILFQDKIVFENKLLENNIDFYQDFEKQPFSDSVRFFLLDENREKIDLILKENDIIGSIETLEITDFRQQKKYQYLYFKVAFVVVIIILLIQFFKVTKILLT